MVDNAGHGPISRALGPDLVARVIDGMFFTFETFLILWAAAAAITSWRMGRSRGLPRVAVTHATVNGQSIRLALDTGSSLTILTRRATRRLGLRAVRLTFIRLNFARGLLSLTSTPVRLALGTQVFEGPMPVLNMPWFSRIRGFDGLLGWPEVRENILFFDSQKRVVRRLEGLPSETAGWLKLKLRPGDQLMLETPLTNGETGTILVDTGSAHGASLREARMNGWRAAHPRAPATSLVMSLLMVKMIPGAGMVDGAEVWADEISLGGLTLTDVPLRCAHAIETNRPQRIGSLGLYALSRMDLVVDGINGFAYIQPKARPGPAYPAIKRPGVPHGAAFAPQDWEVAENVQIRDAHGQAFNCLARSAERRKMHDYRGALAECDRALELDPGNVSAWQIRANSREKEGDHAGAIADCNRAIELDPGNPGIFLTRALIKARQGERGGARDDIKRARELGAGRVRIFLMRGLLFLGRYVFDRRGQGGRPGAAGPVGDSSQSLPVEIKPVRGNLESTILGFSLLSAVGGGMLLLAQWKAGPFDSHARSHWVILGVSMVFGFPVIWAIYARVWLRWLAGGKWVNGEPSPRYLVGEWSEVMMFWAVYSMWTLSDLPLAGVALAGWFWITGLYMTLVWYYGARRLVRAPAPRGLRRFPAIKLFGVAILAGLIWLTVLYWVPGAPLSEHTEVKPSSVSSAAHPG